MKKYTLMIFLCSAQILFGAELFTIDNNNKIIATQNPENTIGLLLNMALHQQILNNAKQQYSLNLPFFGQSLQFRLEKHKVIYDGLQITSKTKSGNVLLDIRPNLLTYKIFHNGKSVGIINFVNGKILATFQISGRQYEISKFKEKYILFEATNSINSSNFECGVEQPKSRQSNNNSKSSFTPKCIELAIDIDYYSRQTFVSDQETTNWALAIISGVSQIYEAEFNVGVTVVHVQIWNTPDPYDTPVLNGNAGGMLSELGNYWNTNNGAINRDLVHLLSKRSNTGTGGIAWLGVLCSASSGYAFSSYLDNDTTYSFPNPSYTWNLMVVSHEIGHNVGSQHTHSCGWAPDPTYGFIGGGIDDCGVVSGSANACSPPAPSPPAGIGTIMSYCHVGGSGVVLDFHDIVVSQALTPGVNAASCITTCDYYGCTDPTAFNYDPNATVDDSSCVLVIFGCTDILAANYDPNANTDDGNCTYCASLIFTVSEISCDGANDGAIDMLVQLGTPPVSLSYSWVGPNGFSSNAEDISILQEGSYTITVADGLGCVDVATLIINNPLPIAIDSLTSTNVHCNGASDGDISIYMSGGTLPYSYNWSGVNPSALPAGTYTVYVTDLNNCPSVSTTVIITQPPVLSSTTIITDISCYGQANGSIDLTTTGGTTNYTYQWHGPNSFFDTNEDVFSLQIGTYTVLITDANGCTNILNPIIIEPAVLAASSIINDVSCNGGNDGSIDLSVIGGVAPYSYTWNNGSTIQDQNNLISAIYTVDIIDTNGCTVPAISFNVNQPLPSSLSAQINSVDCNGNNNGVIDITYVPDIGVPYSFSWVGPNGFTSTLDDITTLFAGMYTLNITESSCVITNAYFVSEPSPVLSLETVQQVSCFDSSNGSVLLLISGGTPIYVTDWSGLNPQSLSAGIHTYTITDNNNCVFTDTVLVSQPNPLNVNYNIINVSCYNGISGSVSLNITGGTFPYTSAWQNANPLQLPAGFHSYTILDGNACAYSDSVFVNQPPPILITENVTDVLCSGDNSGSAILIINGGVSPYQENWYGFNNLSLQAGSYLYDITDANNCTTTAIILISEPNPIVASNSISSSSCPNSTNGQINVDISGGVGPYQQNWFGINPFSLSAGSYNYNIVDANNCVDSNQVIVPSISNLSVNNITYNVSCFGFCDGSINLSITNGISPYAVNWFSFQPDSLCEGDYHYRITDDLGCTLDDTISILMPQPLALSLSLNGMLLGATISGGTNPYSYFWWDANGSLGNSSSIIVSQSGDYSCVVVDINNCHSDTVKYFFSGTDVVEMISKNIKLYPNPFSDFITIEISIEYKDLNLSLHNVIGEIVFQQNHFNTSKIQISRKDLSSGVYFLGLNFDAIRIWKKIIIE